MAVSVAGFSSALAAAAVSAGLEASVDAGAAGSSLAEVADDEAAAAAGLAGLACRRNHGEESQQRRAWQKNDSRGTHLGDHDNKEILLLDVAVGDGLVVGQHLAGEDDLLELGGVALLILDLVLDSAYRVGRLGFDVEVAARERLDEDLHFV